MNKDQEQLKYKRNPIYGIIITVLGLLFCLALNHFSGVDKEVVIMMIAFFMILGFWFGVMAYVVISTHELRVYKSPLNTNIIPLKEIDSIDQDDKKLIINTTNQKRFKIQKATFLPKSQIDQLVDVLQSIIEERQ